MTCDPLPSKCTHASGIIGQSLTGSSIFYIIVEGAKTLLEVRADLAVPVRTALLGRTAPREVPLVEEVVVPLDVEALDVRAAPVDLARDGNALHAPWYVEAAVDLVAADGVALESSAPDFVLFLLNGDILNPASEAVYVRASGPEGCQGEANDEGGTAEA